MTLDEALLEMDKHRDYLVYRDAETRRRLRAGAPAATAIRPDRILNVDRHNASLTSRAPSATGGKTELVIITGLSGPAKAPCSRPGGLGYYSVDNLPIELIPKFAELTKNAPNIRRAALVVDIREGAAPEAFPGDSSAHPPPGSHPAAVPRSRRRSLAPPLQRNPPSASAGHRTESCPPEHPPERERLAPIRALADPIINTTKFNVHELREIIHETFRRPARSHDPDPGARHQLRLPPRRSARQRPGVRRPLPAQSELHPGSSRN